MKTTTQFMTLLSLVSASAFAQIGIGTLTPDASAALEISSTDKGVLIPRVADHTTIVSPAEGLQVYNTTTDKVMLYDGANWVEVNTPMCTRELIRTPARE